MWVCLYLHVCGVATTSCLCNTKANIYLNQKHDMMLHCVCNVMRICLILSLHVFQYISTQILNYVCMIVCVFNDSLESYFLDSEKKPNYYLFTTLLFFIMHVPKRPALKPFNAALAFN